MNIKHLLFICVVAGLSIFSLTATILSPTGPEVYSGPVQEYIVECPGHDKDIMTKMTSNYGNTKYFSDKEEVKYVTDECTLYRI